MKNWTMIKMGVILVGLILCGSEAWAAPEHQGLPVVPGQSRTLLPNGSILLLGGQDVNDVRGSGEVWNLQTLDVQTLSNTMTVARAWHTATMLPDGTVLIAGGLDAAKEVVVTVERFTPATGTFDVVPGLTLTPRAFHTATVLTDGRVLIGGGRSASQEVLDLVELWYPRTGQTDVLPQGLSLPREHHEATLQADGGGLFSGGHDPLEQPHQLNDAFDSEDLAFTLTQETPTTFSLPILLDTVLPVDGTTDVSLDSYMALRFSRPVQVASITPQRLVLRGPDGPVEVHRVPVEDGLLIFVTPVAPLLPATAYQLESEGLLDHDENALASYSVSFTTVAAGNSKEADPLAAAQSVSGQPGQAVSQASAGVGPSPTGTVQTAASRQAFQSPWRQLGALQAAPGITAVAGQVLTLEGSPVANVTLRVNQQSTTTDSTGRFLLPTPGRGGHQVLIMDGTTANGQGHTYGSFEVGVHLKPGRTRALPFTLWMPEIDVQQATTLQAPTTQAVKATTPALPGLEVHIPAQVTLRRPGGSVLTSLSITPLAVDQAPVPVPDGTYALVSLQTHGATVVGQGANGHTPGVRIIFPNTPNLPAGARVSFMSYDAAGAGWFAYGEGRVSADRQQIIPDPGISLEQVMCFQAFGLPSNAPATGPKPGNYAKGGDPVDLGTGLFVLEKTDLVIPDVHPITMTRTYRQNDPMARAFGLGASHTYDWFIVGDAFPCTYAEVVLPDGSRIHYDRVDAGTSCLTSAFEHTASPTQFYRSTLTQESGFWSLNLTNGTTYKFGKFHFWTETPGPLLTKITDRLGNQIHIIREEFPFPDPSKGRIKQIISPHGRVLTFTHDSAHRISQVTDHTGRTVSYAYDTSGRLQTVTDPTGGVTTYTYDASHRMRTINDARNILYLTNEYDTNGRVSRQIQADNSEFLFTYVEDGNGQVMQTDVTNPRGFTRRVTFSTDGYPLIDTSALGQPEEQTLTYEVEAGTNLLQSVTDALGRKTALVTDAFGNVTIITRMADTVEALTTTLTYEPTYQQVASVTDPLTHTTTFSYDPAGNLETVTDHLNQTVVFGYNGEGQVTSVTDGENNVTQLTYESGDLADTIDPLSRPTQRFTDTLGRLLQVTNRLGYATQYAYDARNHLTQIIEANQAATAMTYDPNGNLLTVTDAGNGTTAYAYDALDRISTRTDPLNNPEAYLYDLNGNLAQVTDRNGQVTTFAYDGLDRRTQVTYDNNSTITYLYDAGNRLKQVIDSLSGTITRAYDNFDRLTSETTPQGSVSYGYDDGGRRTSMTVAGQLPVTYTYDNVNRLTQITQGAAAVTYTYDAAHRRTTVTLPNGILVTYGYDVASQLTSLTYTQGPTILGTLTYAYDDAGNRTTVGGTWARTGLPQPQSTFLYNAANRLTKLDGVRIASDGNGNLLDGRKKGQTLFDYTWDARNQLVDVSDTGVSASFAYDGLGRRVSKTVNGAITEFLYDGLNPVQELSGGSIVANLLTGLGIDEFVIRTEGGSPSTILTDALGSTVALTDGTGTVQTEYTYEPFGAVTTTGAGNSNAYQYTGREQDGTSLMFYRARYYSPTLHRFISEDPIGLAGGDNNLYAYVSNSPLRLRDPLGLWGSEVHDHLFNQRFGETAPNLLNAMKAGSKHVDRLPATLLPGNGPEHANTPKGGNQAEAFKAMCDFIKDQMGQFRQFLNSGNTELAYWHFGQAMHSVQDSTSPLHSGMQNWPSSNSLNHGSGTRGIFPDGLEGMDALTPQLETQTLNLMGAVASGDYSVMKFGKKNCGQ